MNQLRALGEDAELVAFGIGEYVPLDVAAARANERRPERQNLRLVAPDVRVHAVFDGLALGHWHDPDQWSSSSRIDDRHRPLAWAAFGLTPLVAEHATPPVGQCLMVIGVETQVLESRHRRGSYPW